LATDGAATNGEFLLDAMRIEDTRSDAPATDARHNAPGLKRALPGAEGGLEPIQMTTSKDSYPGNSLRGYDAPYTQRSDLADYLYGARSLPPR
jgi:hypothetical protein